MALPEPMVGAPVNATGAIAHAPIGTTLPTDATAELDAAFNVMGLVGEDGVSLSTERTRDDKRAWGGQIVRTVQSAYGETITFTLLESAKLEVLRALFGAENVTESAGKIAITHNEQTPAKGVFSITIKDGNRRRRLVAGNAQLVMDGDVTYVHSELISYSVTVTCYPDEDGNNVVEYIDLPTVTP